MVLPAPNVSRDCCARRLSAWRSPRRSRASPADRHGRKPVLLASAVLAIAVGLAMPALLSAGTGGVFAFLALRARRDGAHLRAAPGRCCRALPGSQSATPARPALTISAASSALPSRRRWRRFSRRAAASPGSAITSRSPAWSAFSRCSACGRRRKKQQAEVLRCPGVLLSEGRKGFRSEWSRHSGQKL